MSPDPTPPPITPPVGTDRPRRWLAWTSLILSLIFPLTYVFVVMVVLLRNLTPSGGNPFAASVYTIFDYFEWPFPLVAVILGHIAIARGGPGRNVALAGLILGYLSILALLGTIIALAISSTMNAH
jgi:hypothetical protein